MDTAHAEAVESGLETLIEKRDRQRRQTEGESDEEALWMASCRRYAERERTQTLSDRLRYHEAIGEAPPERGFFAWWRRVLSGRG